MQVLLAVFLSWIVNWPPENTFKEAVPAFAQVVICAFSLRFCVFATSVITHPFFVTVPVPEATRLGQLKNWKAPVVELNCRKL